MISTRNLGALPDIPTLRRLTRSLAMLDAIMSPEWESRYYSFDSHWGPGELMGSMRNGQGDDWFALFTGAGVVVIGLDHEAPMFRPGNPGPGVIDALPSELRTAVDEPAFDARNCTFCIWCRTTGASWEHGPVDFADGDDPDGSAQPVRRSGVLRPDHQSAGRLARPLPARGARVGRCRAGAGMRHRPTDDPDRAGAGAGHDAA